MGFYCPLLVESIRSPPYKNPAFHVGSRGIFGWNIFWGDCCVQKQIDGWNYPGPSNSHHQDYSIFSRESQLKPSFVTCYSVGVD